MEGGLVGILGKIGFDWQVALANLVSFVIIFLILKKYAFGPVGKVIEERKKKIDKGLTDAEQAESLLKTAEIKKKEIIHSARDKADVILKDSQEESKNLIRFAKEQAETEKSDILVQGRKDAEKEIENAKNDFNKESSEIIISGIKKIVEGHVAEGGGEEIIKEMVKG